MRLQLKTTRLSLLLLFCPCIFGQDVPYFWNRGVSFDNGAYGFLNSGGTTGTATGAVFTSIFADNRIVAFEFNANSDERVKENVH